MEQPIYDNDDCSTDLETSFAHEKSQSEQFHLEKGEIYDTEGLYYFDLSDNNRDIIGRSIQLTLSDSAILKDQDRENHGFNVSALANKLIDELSYEEITGQDDYCDEENGYPMSDLDRVSREFDSIVCATKAA